MAKEQQKAPCRVRIVKSTSAYSWYKDMIGAEFDTDLAGARYDYVVWNDFINKKPIQRHIKQDDCVKI